MMGMPFCAQSQYVQYSHQTHNNNNSNVIHVTKEYQMKQADLIGQWRIVSWTHKSKADGEIFFPFGQNPEGHITFTDKTFLCVANKNTQSTESLPKLNSPFYQDETTTVSVSGQYELEDLSIIFHYEECSEPTLTGQSSERNIWFDEHQTFILSGDKMIDGQMYSIRGTFVKE